jgi:hypothetical protein
MLVKLRGNLFCDRIKSRREQKDNIGVNEATMVIVWFIEIKKGEPVFFDKVMEQYSRRRLI